ncbi:hypothetical protein [Desulfotruncus alcoholivorax]|uniref:hypothetical protein n=1 Tax=Desulfotruncus alcoholivorax TaxID=265477 RepID=UPI000405E0BE|nr:hypothetical protein [Desulfotruncus alcoholivorax]
MPTISLQELRDQIMSGTREQVFLHNSKSDGSGVTVASHMVYVPKFRVPTGIWESGNFPPKDLMLGGFWFDKYQCSQPDATSLSRGTTGANAPGLVAAASRAGVVPWTDIDWNNAKTACANRVINGRACHLVTMREWAAVCFLIKLLGHDIRGNNFWGRDYRDPDSYEYYGVTDPILASYNASYSKACSRVLTGSGPVTWAHNGMANGIFDIVGNVFEWVDFLINAGVYQHQKQALLNDADGITAADSAIVIDNIQDIDSWPAANGLILIKAEGVNTDEYIIYGNMVKNGDGSATLTGCLRGQNGTAASAHADNATIIQLTDYCIIPGGYSAKINGVGLNNTDAVSTFDYESLVLGPGAANPAVNDVLQIENEQVTVTAVNGTSLTVTRGSNGSTIAAHADGVAIAKLSPQMSNNSPSSTGDYGASQSASFLTLRTETNLVGMGLPATVSSGGSEEYKDIFYTSIYGQRAAHRGGNWSNGSGARSGFALYLYFLPSSTSLSVGFRAALSL